ncbi:hypothetical protein [Natrononativus amylolyticus]|uniref:hypothetical protein n=1 Tax=Natrononativus amylolyticus TaxID=2963434 RepID=UPI0020CC6685|nr:hypothetical protein [Natrononativus amylolyticus]
MLDVVGLGPTDAVFVGLSLALTASGAAFVYYSSVSVPVYVPTIVFVTTGTVLVGDLLRYGPAALESVATTALAPGAVAALALGERIGFGARRLVDGRSIGSRPA